MEIVYKIKENFAKINEFNFAYIYVFLWILYSVLPFVYNSTGLLNLLLYFFASTALFYSFFILTHLQLNFYFRILFLFVFILSIYGFELMLVGDNVFWQHVGSFIEKNRFVLWLYTSLLTISPMYVFSIKGYIGNREMRIFFFIMLAACIYDFYGSIKLYEKIAALRGLTQEEFTITNVYSFLSILPLLVLFKKRLFLQMILLSVMLVYFILSAKRGAIFIGGACSLILIFSSFSKMTNAKKIEYLLLVLCLFVGVYEFVVNQMENNAYFTYRIDQTLSGYTSGRDEYFRNILDYFENRTSLSQFLIGIGAQGTLSVNYSFAHNDWLAILLEHGLLGLLLYIFYWIGFVCTCIKYRYNQECFLALVLLLMIGLGKSFFSMYYLPVSQEMIMSSGYYALVLGFFLAKAYPQQTL